MDIEQLISKLNAPGDMNNALKLLGQILVDIDPRLTQSLSAIIKDPESIEDTNRFASILEILGEKDFIQPLVDMISRGKPDKNPWLADYMYALGSLLMGLDEWLRPKKSFVSLLGGWLRSTDDKDIAWKAAVILSQLDHPETHDYLLNGAADKNLTSQTRIACINGMVNHYSDEAEDLLERLADDPDDDIQEEIARAFDWLYSDTE